MRKKIFLVAGEASGDLHGADLSRALLTLDPDLHLRGMGGERMREAGVQLVVHAGDMAAVGITEVVLRLTSLWRAFRRLREALALERPALLVLIDFPDFNFWLARAARRIGIPIVYYISPQVWAWRKGRIQTLKQLVEKILVIFPFEEPLYQEAGVPVTFVGHPMLDRLRAVPSREEARRRLGFDPSATVVGLLPGSRETEVRHHLSILQEGAARIAQAEPHVQFLWAVADSLSPHLVETLLSPSPPLIRPIYQRTYEVMRAADLLITASGTATLEAGLLGTPMIIVYRVSPVTWWMGRLLVDVPSIGMVNLVAGRRVVPELLQKEFTPARVAETALDLLRNPEALRTIQQELERVQGRLGTEGASLRAAREILKTVEQVVARGEG